jgi:hypothetical protein
VIETETMDMPVDHAKKTHARDSTKATDIKRILGSYADTRVLFGLSCGGFLEYSIFLPFFTKGKRFFEDTFSKVILPSPPTCTQFNLSNFLTRESFSSLYGNPTLFRLFGFCLLPGSHCTRYSALHCYICLRLAQVWR